MSDWVEVLTLLSFILNLVLAAGWLVDRSRRRGETPTTQITNVDSHPQVVNVGSYVYNINVSSHAPPVVNPVPGPAQTANDHGLTEAGGEAPLTGGVCLFEAPPRPEL